MTEAATTRLRLAGFAGLATLTAMRWVALVENPPIGRASIAVLCSVAGAVALTEIATRVPSRVRAWALAAIAGVTILVGAALALGVPAGLLVPSGWGQLFSNLGSGIGSLGGADYPYAGGDQWSRLGLLLALAPLLALAAALVFWPARSSGRRRRGLGLVLLVTAYATAVTVSPPSQPMLQGLVLFVVVAGWIWLPAVNRRGAVVAATLAVAAGLAAVPVAARLNTSKPWLDYHHWDWSGSPLGDTESFDWDQTYGPLEWPRDGRPLLEVRSSAPQYWATAVLDEFDGFRWVSSPTGLGMDLPQRRGGVGVARLNPRWLVRARFADRALSSQLLVGTGTVLSVAGIGAVQRTSEGMILRKPIGNGDDYSIRAYVPQPTIRQMRVSEGRYPRSMSPYTTIEIPHVETLAPPPDDLVGSSKAVTLSTVTAPLRGDRPSARFASILERSPYAPVYRLATRLAARKPTAYDVVTAMLRYLRSNYRYSESPPQRSYPLRAFLFRDRIGYCQQFSGAMALMLRLAGIPSRVVGGFAPGSWTGDRYLVSDFDAHSWVEVYFNGIGWVTFDPTPPAAPAVSRSSKLGSAGPRPTRLQFPTRRQVPNAPLGRLRRKAGSSAGIPLVWLAIAVVAAALLTPPWMALRRACRRRSLSVGELAEAQAVELDAAVRRLGHPRVGGATLRSLERRLGGIAGPRATDYAARLRDCRFGAGTALPPSPSERRAARRALARGRGTKARVRAWLAMPPGGPTPVTVPPPRS